MDEDDLKRIAGALGLGEDADADTIVTTATSLKAKADPGSGSGTDPGSEAGASLAAIAKAAGLNEDAEAGAIETAVATLREQAATPDPTKFVPADQVAMLSTRLAKLEGDKAATVVDKAIEDGKLVPALREWGVEFCKTNRKGFDAYLEKAPVILDGKPQVDPTRQPGGGGALTEAELVICRATNVDPEAFKKTRDSETEMAR